MESFPLKTLHFMGFEPRFVDLFKPKVLHANRSATGEDLCEACKNTYCFSTDTAANHYHTLYNLYCISCNAIAIIRVSPCARPC